MKRMAPRFSGQTFIFGVGFFFFFFVSKSLRDKLKFEKFANLTRKPRSHASILIHRTWLISRQGVVSKIFHTNKSTLANRPQRKTKDDS